MQDTHGSALLGALLGGRYAVTRLIARGGMGDVYEAHDDLLDRPVAVKVFRAEAPTDRRRFEAEIQTLATLSHPNLLHVFDAGEHDGCGFVVLELIDGPSLNAVLAERGTLSPAAVARLGAAIAGALAAAHERGVVHRDVTPANVLCGSDGRPRLADFGIARLLDTARVTAVATTVGTAAYMAPEQVEGREVTPAADIYALALVLVEALTGRVAFPGPAHEAAVARLVRDPDVRSGVPVAWQPLLRSMTARAPGDRPSAAAVVDRLVELEAALDAAPDARVISGPVAVAGSSPDAHAVTEAVAAGGGTTVMPAALRPTPPEHSGGPGDAGDRRQDRPWVLWLVGVMVALLILLLAGQSGGGFDAPTTTTAPVAVTTPSTAPTTTAPPTTQIAQQGKGGKGKGSGKHDD